MSNAAYFARTTWALLGKNERVILSRVSEDSGVSLWRLYTDRDIPGILSGQMALAKLSDLGLIVRHEQVGRDSRRIVLTEYGRFLVEANSI